MGTFWHRLKPNAAQSEPKEFLFYDTETTPEPANDKLTFHKLKLGTACYVRLPFGKHLYHEDWHTYRTPDQFYDWVEKRLRRKGKLRMYAHNQNFDFNTVDS
ncbi:unnamed protein product, partial [marine sediment metagenome]